MPIQFGSKLSSPVANATFVDKTIDDVKKGKLGLYKTIISEPGAIDDVQEEINTLKSVVDVPGNAFYFGDSTTDGTWRIIQDGTDLKIEIRVGGLWQTRDTFQP